MGVCFPGCTLSVQRVIWVCTVICFHSEWRMASVGPTVWTHSPPLR
jgi:hypothetical protein